MTENRYNPLNLFTSIIHVPHQSVFIKLRYFLLFMLVYSTVVGILDNAFDIVPANTSLGQFHLLFSFCLSIIIAFRINVAHIRWWEGRGYWGSLVNNCRNLAMKFNGYIGLNNDHDFKEYVAKLPLLLKHHLRDESEKCNKVMDELGITHNGVHLPNLLIQTIINKIAHYRAINKISFEQFLAMDIHVLAMTDIIGGCEKILYTPVPKGFSIFTRFALLFYMLIFPFGWVDSFGLFITPIIMVIIYVLLGLEVIAEEMEEPFGVDYNDLPIDAIADRIDKHVNQIATMPGNAHN